MSSPKVKLAEIERLGKLQCTRREAAGFLGIRINTFSRLLRDNADVRKAWERGKQLGLISLRRKQMRLAGSSATMAIFLGKNYLGQRDTLTNEHIGDGGGPVEFDFSRLSQGDRDELRSKLARAARSDGSDS